MSCRARPDAFVSVGIAIFFVCLIQLGGTRYYGDVRHGIPPLIPFVISYLLLSIAIGRKKDQIMKAFFLPHIFFAAYQESL